MFWPSSLFNEIASRSGDVHFRRWKILETPWLGIYIHKIYKSDEDKHLHNHPWSYVSLCLGGKGKEHSEKGTRIIEQCSLSAARSSRFHKLEVEKPITTFFVRGPKKWRDKEAGVSEWGYLVGSECVHHKAYREIKRSMASL